MGARCIDGVGPAKSGKASQTYKECQEHSLSMKSTSCPLCACLSLLVATLSSMINCLVLTSGLAMSTSTSGLLIWLTSPSPVTSGRYLSVRTRRARIFQQHHKTTSHNAALNSSTRMYNAYHFLPFTVTAAVNASLTPFRIVNKYGFQELHVIFFNLLMA